MNRFMITQRVIYKLIEVPVMVHLVYQYLTTNLLTINISLFYPANITNNSFVFMHLDQRGYNT